MTEDHPAAKARLRADMRSRRAVLAGAGDGAALAARLAAALPLRSGDVVAGYAAIGSELPVWPALEAAHGAGADCVLPVVVAAGQPLLFRRWMPDTALVPGIFGAAVPPDGAEVLLPTVVLVPLLAFDRGGWRLGYGGGYYDRTLQALRAAGGPVTAVGIGHAGQEVSAVPRDAYDQRLDWIVTPEYALKVEA